MDNLPLGLKGPGVTADLDTEGNLVHLQHMLVPYNPLGLEVAEKALADHYLTALNSDNESRINLAAITLDLDPDHRIIPRMEPIPNESGSFLRLQSIKSSGGTTVVTYGQTFAGVEIWRATLSVAIQRNALTDMIFAFGFESNLHRKVAEERTLRLSSPDDRYRPAAINIDLLKGVLHPVPETPAQITDFTVEGLLFYRYDPEQRMQTNDIEGPRLLGDPYLPYFNPPIEGTFVAGAHYPVSAVSFDTLLPGTEFKLSWQVFIHVKTGTVLRLWPLIAGCMQRVFPGSVPPGAIRGMGTIMCLDPLTAEGLGANPIPPGNEVPPNPQAINEAMARFCTKEVYLSGLVDLGSNVQLLEGEMVSVRNTGPDPSITLPHAAWPTSGLPNFDYAPYSSDEFSAVNAYYHCESLFRLMEMVGFTNLRTNYFANFTRDRPMLMVDSRGWMKNDDKIGAWTGLAGRDIFGRFKPMLVFGLTQDNNTAVTTGTDWRVVLHEFSHLLLLAATCDPDKPGSTCALNFEFAHSAGDSLAAILTDPVSRLRDLDPHRFTTLPWLLDLNSHMPGDHTGKRYHGGDCGDRDKLDVWGWQGSKYTQDTQRGYDSEQVLSITLFQLYRSLGGDSPKEVRRRFAARYVAYLIIQATRAYVRGNTIRWFIDQLVAADFDGAIFRDDELGLVPAATAHKVIRWAFEHRGHNVTNGIPGSLLTGADVYIADGRADIYGFPVNYQPEIWNRTASSSAFDPGPEPTDVLRNHQPPTEQAGLRNFIYVRINNRGYRPATNVRVKAFFRQIPDNDETKADELVWGSAWNALSPAAGHTAPNNGILLKDESVIIGPFEWNPGTRGSASCVFVSVTSDDDPSNIELPAMSPSRFSVHPLPLWWLTPADNNLGFRAMTVGN